MPTESTMSQDNQPPCPWQNYLAPPGLSQSGSDRIRWPAGLFCIHAKLNVTRGHHKDYQCVMLLPLGCNMCNMGNTIKVVTTRICIIDIIGWDYYSAASSVAGGPGGGFPAGQWSIRCMYKTACLGGMLWKKVITVQNPSFFLAVPHSGDTKSK